MSVVVVVVVTPVSFVPVVVTIPTEVDTPLNVDAASTVTGFETVLIELPVEVSRTVTTLVTSDVDMVASVPTPETVCLEVVDVVIVAAILLRPMVIVGRNGPRPCHAHSEGRGGPAVDGHARPHLW